MSDITLTRLHAIRDADTITSAPSSLRAWWDEFVARAIDRVVAFVPNPLVVPQVDPSTIERGRRRGEPSRVVLDLLEREARHLRGLT